MQDRGELTRSSIKAAALALFSKQGYRQTSVSQICAAAGMSKGAFYHHFPSKSDLFNQLLNDWLADVKVEIEAIKDQGESLAGLDRLARAFTELLRTSGAQLPVLLEFWQAAGSDDEVRTAAGGPYRDFQKLVSDMLAHPDAGRLPLRERDAAARVLVAMGIGMLVLRMLEGSDVQAKDTRKAIRIFKYGIVGRK